MQEQTSLDIPVMVKSTAVRRRWSRMQLADRNESTSTVLHGQYRLRCGER